MIGKNIQKKSDTIENKNSIYYDVDLNEIRVPIFDDKIKFQKYFGIYLEDMFITFEYNNNIIETDSIEFKKLLFSIYKYKRECFFNDVINLIKISNNHDSDYYFKNNLFHNYLKEAINNHVTELYYCIDGKLFDKKIWDKLPERVRFVRNGKLKLL